LQASEPSNVTRRRPGIGPGRRFALGLGIALALLACSATAAPADQIVASATIYPASQGGVSQRAASLQALESCPTYAGSSPVYLYPPGQPYQLTATSWSLSTVITCGLQVPLSDVTAVQVRSPSQGFETPLSTADLSDPSRYHDPQAPDALPVISVDGSEDQTTYTRPFRGGTDDNARDQVTDNGSPITLIVYAGAPPLTVTASAHTLSSTATATTAKLSATVHTESGSPVPASQLTWSWDFGDGGRSAEATPTHRFAAGGYDVTVQVTDSSDGTGGTATIRFTTPTSSAPGSNTQSGGKKPTKSKSPTGTENGNHSTAPSGKTGAKHHTTPSSSPSTNSPTSPAATTGTTTTATTPTTTASASTRAPSSAPARQPAGAGAGRRRTPPTTPQSGSGSLVSGRLVSDVHPLPASSSPLVRTVPTAVTAPPQVRQATRASSMAGAGAALVVVGLLGLGAWHEWRGRRGWQADPSGH
jgi:hypothetical protein